MAFDFVPSERREVYWKYTLNDLKVRVKLYLGQKQADVVQQYQIIARVVSDAFGGEKKDDTFVPENKDQMQMAFNSVFGAK